MAFLTPLPLTTTTPSTIATTTTSKTTRQTYRLRTAPTTATIAAPMAPDPKPEAATPDEKPQAAPWMPLPGIVHEIRTPEQYDRLSAVAKEENKLLIIDFMASWCRKCKYLLPRLRKLATSIPDAYYCTVDVNKVNRLPKQFEITKMPTFVFVKDQHTIATIIGGASPAKVAEDVEKAVTRFVAE